MSHKRIASYRFIPPTTFSGYLLRLLHLSQEKSLPKQTIFKTEKPQISDYHILELSDLMTSRLCSLGAYPEFASTFTSFRMGYQTIVKGHGFADGLDIFDSTPKKLYDLLDQRIEKGILSSEDRKKLSKEIKKSGENKFYIRAVYRQLLLGTTNIPTWGSFSRESRRQPLNWEFLVTPQLTGYIVHSSRAVLEDLQCVKNYGYKIGKEGFAYIEDIEGTYELHIESGEFSSSVIFPVGSNKIHLLDAPRLENVYYFDFDKKRFARGAFALPGSRGRGEYYTTQMDKKNYVIPKETLEIFSGGNLA
ncbi:MAG TPA: hypothetical protein ENN36_04450 [Candidatus Bathyarchaeota archaeon]|nr:hypothetical protein [Candidatus Bathyarchaeota archaeon]